MNYLLLAASGAAKTLVHYYPFAVAEVVFSFVLGRIVVEQNFVVVRPHSALHILLTHNSLEPFLKTGLETFVKTFWKLVWKIFEN